MHSDEKADLLLEFDTIDAESIISEMEPIEANKVRQLIGYPSKTAGGLMVTEYLRVFTIIHT